MAEYIEREALYEKAYWHGEMPDVGNPYAEGVEAVDIKDVDAIPAADVAPVVHSSWILRKDGSGTCKNCGMTQRAVWDDDNAQKYCGCCGAKMDAEASE